ncbi:hypothetical protein EB230_02925 [Mesorhizobium sp. NZP2234]|uniref:hypothetical protein n=1 Tax=Mesorhizobium sp. NZP2234 TaxID=2483402 RepID=UPI0015581C9D|nr:hypothetical protein [Mesorhizobium sp. NZP2234]QKC87492.1 hypothetical protein EB230_02925 [Mesorhizobium sp. NZP2234]
MMIGKPFRGAMAAIVMLAGGVTHVAAASMEALQGAWTMNGTGCEDNFKKRGKGFEYKDRSSTLTTGIIVSGSRVLGPNSSCTAEKISQNGDHFSALLSCSDAILFRSFSASFRVIDKTHFERFDPQFPEVSVIYYKCEF